MLNLKEKYEVVELLGIKALFTEERINDTEVPKGMYKYDLREGDDPDTFYYATLEESVRVNHAGTILTNEPIDLGLDGYIDFGDMPEDDCPGFDGTYMCIEEYAKEIATEACPYCDFENVYVNPDRYIQKCKNCGEEIRLCDKCFHSEDNLTQKCDFHFEKDRSGGCFRGRTHSTKSLRKKSSASEQRRDVSSDKKLNVEYWDSIDNLSEKYIKNLSSLGFDGNDFDESGSDIIYLGKKITEFATELLKTEYDYNFPYVEGNY